MLVVPLHNNVIDDHDDVDNAHTQEQAQAQVRAIHSIHRALWPLLLVEFVLYCRANCCSLDQQLIDSRAPEAGKLPTSYVFRSYLAN